MAIYMRRKELVVRFVPNFYTHEKGVTQRKCWQCRHEYVDGDSVHVAFTEKSPNRTLCTPCAKSLGLISEDAS